MTIGLPGLPMRQYICTNEAVPQQLPEASYGAGARAVSTNYVFNKSIELID